MDYDIEINEIIVFEKGHVWYIYMGEWIYSFAFLGVFVVSCDIVGLYLFLPLGSIILLGDRSRLFHLGIFVRTLLLFMNLIIFTNDLPMSLLNS